jgi:hypothetical protein
MFAQGTVVASSARKPPGTVGSLKIKNDSAPKQRRDDAHWGHSRRCSGAAEVWAQLKGGTPHNCTSEVRSQPQTSVREQE